MNPAMYAQHARKRQQEKEEEAMTQYSADDLNGWEFKIVRSVFGRFNNQELVRQLIAEEAQNGWEMVEKFDECRIRFKRRTDKRALHSGDGIDPYRTNLRPQQSRYATDRSYRSLASGRHDVLVRCQRSRGVINVARDNPRSSRPSGSSDDHRSSAISGY